MKHTLLAMSLLVCTGCPKAIVSSPAAGGEPFLLTIDYERDGSFQWRSWNGASGKAEFLAHPGVYVYCSGQPGTRRESGTVDVTAVINRKLVARSEFPMDVVCPLSADVPVRLALRDEPSGVTSTPPLAALSLSVPNAPDTDGLRIAEVVVPNRTGLQLLFTREIAHGVRLRCEAPDPAGGGDLTVRLEVASEVQLEQLPASAACDLGAGGRVEVAFTAAGL